MKVLIIGAGKLAELACYCFQNDTEHEVVAFCVESLYGQGKQILNGLPVCLLETLEERYPPHNYTLYVAIGRNSARVRLYQILKNRGYSFVNYVSSKATVWPDLEMGENVFIDQGCGLHPFVKVGNNVLLIGARVGHHSHIGNNVLLSGTTLAGNVTIGEGSFLGLNSCVKEGVRIGTNNIIGAGVFIKSNTQPNAVYRTLITPVHPVDSKRINQFH